MDRAERDIEREDFINKLVENGIFYLPKGAVTHDLALAAFAMSSELNVRRQMLYCKDGDSIASRTAAGRTWITVEDIHQWIRDGAGKRHPNPNLARKDQCDDQTSSESE